MQIPDRLQVLARNPKVKLTMILEYPQEAGQCTNCGGCGYISFFLATMGPFDTPGQGRVVSKFHNGKWWSAPSYIDPAKDDEKTNGRFGTVSAPCPVCKGIRQAANNPYVLPPEEMRRRIKAVVAKNSVK